MYTTSKIGASILALLLAFPAYADKRVEAKIKDVYRMENQRVPVQVTDCYNVDVPIYQNQQGNAAEGALLGMIIGGILGKGATGNDDGAAAGAVIGGLVGADKAQKGKDKIVGYRKERRCDETTLYENKKVKVYKYSTITFYNNGEWYTLEYRK